MADTVKERLSEFLRTIGVNKSEFGRRIGVSSAFITSMRKSIQPDKIKAIQSEFPNLNTNWLLTGEGEMLCDGGVSMSSRVTAAHPDRIPLIPASAFAGKVNGFAPESVSPDICETIISLVPGAELAIPITGDSMEPDYPDGSLAYIKRINESAFIPWGHTVVLDTENGAFIKRIYPDQNDEEYVWGKSINPDYPPMHIPKSSIFRIFRVLGTSRIYTTM